MTDTFNFPYHRVKTQYPDNVTKVQLGNAYEFASAPNAPDQRIFILTFPAMKFFLDGGGNVDATQYPEINYKAFRNFYEAHRQHVVFIYPHPEFGNINVRFHKPLQDPDSIPGGDGVTEQFEVELVEQP